MLKKIKSIARKLKSYAYEMRLKTLLAYRWVRYRSVYSAAVPPQPSDIIVSLTSYAPRFGTLHLTLKSLLTQSVRPYAVVLWIGHDDIHLLPTNVLELTRYGLIIEPCTDIRSHTKLIPSLIKYPNNTIVTADDDVYYWRRWLEELCNARQADNTAIVCHRMHRIRFNKENTLLNYNEWEYESIETEPSDVNFATGVLGVLYPPHSLHSDVLDTEKALRLCPAADDVWFYWMARLNNTPIRRVNKTTPIYCWKSSQHVALSIQNTCEGFNDVQIKRIIEAYGVPIRATSRMLPQT